MSDLNSPVQLLVGSLNTNKCPLRHLADPEIFAVEYKFHRTTRERGGVAKVLLHKLDMKIIFYAMIVLPFTLQQ